MDEYLFAVLAKLQADRQTLTREERRQSVVDAAEGGIREVRDRAVSAVPPDLLSIVPTHGLRGWS